MCNKRRKLCHDRVNLTNRLIHLRQRFVDGDGSVQPLIDDTECALKSLYIREFQGVKIRSRAKWLKEGECPTHYLFKLEQTQIRKSRVHAIYDANGVEVSSQVEIAKAHVDFCTNSFSEELIDLDKQSDTTSFVKTVRLLERLFDVIRLYEQGSGAKLNVSKTEAMWLGAWRSHVDKPLGLTWVKKMKILGVVFGECTEQDNWQPKLTKLEKHLNLWKS